MSALSPISADQALKVANRVLSVPLTYKIMDFRLERQGDATVWVLRYERSDGVNTGLGGEHMTFVVDESTFKILGLTQMNSLLADNSLPGQEEAERTAIQFIAEVAPDLSGTLDIRWIKPHDEIIDLSGKPTALTGMKVKMQQQDGRYAWVIVGPRESIVTFERDIVWNYNMSERTTEKWLHDRWIQLQRGG